MSNAYKQAHNQHNPYYSRAPFTPANQQQPQAQPQSQQSQQQATQNAQQQQNPQGPQRSLYLNQIGAVLTQQPPPQTPQQQQQQQQQQQSQSNTQSGRLPAPPPPQQQQPQQPSQSQQQQQQPPQNAYNPSNQAQQAAAQATGFMPTAAPFNPPEYFMYSNPPGRPIPLAAAAGQPQPQPTPNLVYINPSYVHIPAPQAPQPGAPPPPHFADLSQTHPGAAPAGAYIPQPAGLYQHPFTIYNHHLPGQWMPQLAAANAAPPPPPQQHRPPQQQMQQQTQPPQTDNYPAGLITSQVIPTTNPQLIAQQAPMQPQQTLAYSPYQFTPTNIPLAAQTQSVPPLPQPYQKREKKPLLIVDPNTKQPVIAQPQQSTTPTPAASSQTQTNTSKPTELKPAQTTTTTTQATTTITVPTTAVSSQVNKDKDKDKEKDKAQDLQAQVLRNMKEQQTIKPVESNTTDNTPSSDNTTQPTPITTKPVSKQATVSVQQQMTSTSESKVAPVVESQETPSSKQPISYSSVASKPKAAVVPPAVAKSPSPAPVVKTSDDNNNTNQQTSQTINPEGTSTQESTLKKEEEPVKEEKPTEAPVVVVEESKPSQPEPEGVPTQEEPVASSTFWTPENQTAKKRYDREFLISLKDKKLSKTFPDVLKGLDIIQDINITGGSGVQKSPYYSKSSYGGQSQQGDQQSGQGMYGKGSMSKKSMSQKLGSMTKYSKGSMDGSRNQPTTVINLDKDLQLKRTENPYQIKKISSEHEELLREVRNILNKLTPQNLQKLTGDLINLPINTEDRLKDAIDIIFEKSIDEQVFSQTYAELCRILAQIRVPINNEPGKFINFRTMLLTRCQREFDSDYSQNIQYEKLVAEAEACTDELKKKELKEIADDKLWRAKRRSLGNIRFIGELFKLKMLTEGIMNDCIERLLKQETDEENLECLCKLLTTIGKELDKPVNVNKMKNYFDKLDKISKKKDTVSARIRFMIMDVIDLRKSQWISRRKDNAPKKIDEIRKEAEEEQLRQEAEYAKQAQLDKQRQGQGQKGVKFQQSQQNVSRSTSMDSEAFHARSNKAQNGSMASKIKDVKQITNKNLNGDFTLGPGGGTGFSWSKPKLPAAEATGASAAPLPQSSSFSWNKPKVTESQSSSRLSMDSSASIKQDRQIQNVKRMDSVESKGSAPSSQASSRETSQSRASSRASESTTSVLNTDKLQKAYTSDQIDRKTANLLDEYSQHRNVSEALKDIEEFRPVDPEQYSEFVEKVILTSLERNESIRSSLGLLFNTALKEKKLEQKHFEEGLKRVIEIAEDMAIDIPKISTYLSQTIAPLFNENTSVSFLQYVFEPIMESRICADMIAETLHNASNRLGHSSIADIFKSSGLNLNQFLKGVDSPSEYIKEKNLQWILGNRERTQSASISAESYESRLNQILENRLENEIIFDKIETEFAEADYHSRVFIRALVISVCNSCLVDKKIDAELFKKRGSILNKFIAKKEDLELEALYAIQALDHRMKHQPGFIRVLFDLLYDEDIIREDVFWQWKKEGKEEGHAISALSLKGFFEWLAETDADGGDA